MQRTLIVKLVLTLKLYSYYEGDPCEEHNKLENKPPFATYNNQANSPFAPKSLLQQYLQWKMSIMDTVTCGVRTSVINREVPFIQGS